MQYLFAIHKWSTLFSDAGVRCLSDFTFHFFLLPYLLQPACLCNALRCQALQPTGARERERERESFLQGEEMRASSLHRFVPPPPTQPKGYIPTATIFTFLASMIDFLRSRSEHHAETSTFAYFITPVFDRFFKLAGLQPSQQTIAPPNHPSTAVIQCLFNIFTCQGTGTRDLAPKQPLRSTYKIELFSCSLQQCDVIVPVPR